MIGLELSPRLVRGVRIGPRVRCACAEVTPDRERDAVRRVLSELGGGDEIHAALRGITSATTLLLPHAREEMGPVSRHVPQSGRELAWEALAVAQEKTLLVAGSRSEVEERLDTWGFMAGDVRAPVGVGLTTAAVFALSAELPEGGDLVLADEGRVIVVFTRQAREVTEIGRIVNSSTVGWITGSEAEKVAAQFPNAQVWRPGGLDPAYAIAYGAALWNTPAFPFLPNLEPKERREFRARRVRENRAVRTARMAAGLILAAAGVVYFPARVERARAAEELVAAEARVESDADSVNEAGRKVAALLASDREPGRLIEEVLIAAGMVEGVRLTEVRAGEIASRYSGLRARGAAMGVIVAGRAVSSTALDALLGRIRTAHPAAAIEEASRTADLAMPIRFRMVIP